MEKNLLLLILLPIFLKAETEFIFSYRFGLENSYITHQQIYISRAMVKTKLPKKVICIIKKRYNKNISIKKYLLDNSDKLMKCFNKKIYINSYSINELDKSYSKATLKMEPIRFTVKFNRGFGIISTFIKQ